MIDSLANPQKIRSVSRKMTRRNFLRAGVRGGVGIGALSVSSLAWGAGVEVNWVEIVEINVTLPRLPRAFDGFRLAQISDVHIEGGAMRRHFPDIARLTTAQGADAIVLTGDYTTHADNWQENALYAGFRELKAPSGVFAVLGNHDQWFSPDDRFGGAAMARSALSRAGAHELKNDAFAIERNGEKLWMCGIDDWATGHSDLSAFPSRFSPQNCAILLAHEPDFADDVALGGRFDLMLSGHSHGGQIALPLVGPVHLPAGGRKYPRGRYQVEDMMLYTNRGLGVVDLPIRFCARPEITVLTLKAA
ncbi:hypothetical protein B1R32_12216 [Abditibacterium utsteinense]|uniref:Calcineurin-like phosphoesterase domain-containing protein n=1 Tax=Abditibacterium utsteinense TaxID=1960156 RepID=A0A2S8SPS0_9BACT|nr:metallophosphoesterase [Abditibacterium utsteinense]PQV62769.1 hypothetical protein B1R32_12216 [Abditibacterium utsteinense]